MRWKKRRSYYDSFIRITVIFRRANVPYEKRVLELGWLTCWRELVNAFWTPAKRWQPKIDAREVLVCWKLNLRAWIVFEGLKRNQLIIKKINFGN